MSTTRTLYLAAALLTAPAAQAETISGSMIRVIDGDTIAIEGSSQHIRLLDIDTPEITRPRCAQERERGHKARERLRQLIGSREIAITRHGTDRYRRALARMQVDGYDIGQILLAEGHAVIWHPGRAAWQARAQHWCGNGRR